MQDESTIESMCRDHCDEIERRRLLIEQQEINTDFVGKCGFYNAGCTPDVFVDTDQMVFVFSISHESIPPRSRDATDPGVRIYGAFPTQDLAIEFAHELATKDNEISVLTAPMREWNVMSSSVEMLQNTEAVSDIKRQILETHETRLQRNKDEFEAKRAQIETNDKESVRGRGSEEGKQKKKYSIKEMDDECKLYKKRFDRSCEIRNQNFAVVSFLSDNLNDDGDRKHPLFCVWKCFDTEQKASEWIVNVGGNHVKDYDMDIVCLYEWLHPQYIQTSSFDKIQYRNAEQDKIMNFQLGQKSVVEGFKRECEESGCETPYIDIN